MENVSRDLLFVSKFSTLSNVEMEKQFFLLSEMLHGIESMTTSAIVHEVMDLNKYRVIKKAHLVARAMGEKNHKPFVFIYNKN